MPVVAPCVAGQPILNGVSTTTPSRTPAAYTSEYNPGSPRVIAIPSGDSLSLFQTLDKRYKYHGGVGGSGNWEH